MRVLLTMLMASAAFAQDHAADNSPHRVQMVKVEEGVALEVVDWAAPVGRLYCWREWEVQPTTLMIWRRNLQARGTSMGSRDVGSALLRSLFSHDGFLELDGFWEPSDGFDRSVSELQSGERFIVAIRDAGSRIACLMLCDKDGRTAGVITNPGESSYSDFVSALTGLINTSTFAVVLHSLDSEPAKTTGRIHFRVRLDSEVVAKIRSERRPAALPLPQGKS